MKCNIPSPKEKYAGRAPSAHIFATGQEPYSARPFLKEKGFDAYRQEVAAREIERLNHGQESYADAARSRIYEQFAENKGVIPVDKAADMAMSILPKADNFDVQSAFAAEMAARIIHDDPDMELSGNDLWYLGNDASKVKREPELPMTYPQNRMFDTTEKNIVDANGNILKGLRHADNANATQLARRIAKQPMQTFMDADTAVTYMEKQNETIKKQDDLEKLLAEADLIPDTQLPADIAEIQDMTLTESVDTTRMVFTDKIKHGESFYFRIFHDFRGRFYYKTRFFNPQGTSFEKASVAFVGSELKAFRQGSEQYNQFAIHMANLAGKDKGEYALYNARIKWFDENIHSVDDVLKHFDEEDWPEATMHWFMAQNGQAGNIPIARDSTTSGYQIVATVMGDLNNLGKLTNISGDNAFKGDLYVAAAEKSFKEAGIDVGDAFAMRKVFKKPTMMYIYNADPEITIAPKVAEEYIKLMAKKHFKGKTPTKGEVEAWGNTIKDNADRLGKAFIKVLVEDPQFKTANDFKNLIEEAYLVNQDIENGAVSWTFPDGQTITFNPVDGKAFKKQDDTLYKTRQSVNYKGIKFTYKGAAYKRLNRSRDKAPRALMANFVQSIDAYLAAYTGNNLMKEGYPFIGVHDSFATAADGVTRMQQLYLEGLTTLITPDESGMTFLQKAIRDISGGKKEYEMKIGNDIIDRIKTSIYALS